MEKKDTIPLKVLGFGDNVVDKYEHCKIMYPGGNCVNFAVFAKSLKVACAAYMGYFGDDEAGDYVRNVLSNLGIEMSFCRQLQGENGCAKVTIQNGDRVFLGSNHGGVRGTHKYELGADEMDYIRTFDIVHSGNYCFTEEMLPEICRAGVPISFDFSDDSSEEYYQKVAPQVTYAFCSRSGDDREVREHLKWVKGLGPDLVMASRGEAGAMLYDGDCFYQQKAVPLDKLVDTMGAGDSLITAFLVHFLHRVKNGQNKKKAIPESLELAAAFAAKTCATEGSFGFGKSYE